MPFTHIFNPQNFFIHIQHTNVAAQRAGELLVTKKLQTVIHIYHHTISFLPCMYIYMYVHSIL